MKNDSVCLFKDVLYNFDFLKTVGNEACRWFHLMTSVISTDLMTVDLSSGYNKPKLATASAWEPGANLPAGWGSGRRRPSRPHQQLQCPDSACRMLPCPPPPPSFLPVLPAARCYFWKTFLIAAPLFLWSLFGCLSNFGPSSFARSPVVKCCRCKS